MFSNKTWEKKHTHYAGNMKFKQLIKKCVNVLEMLYNRIKYTNGHNKTHKGVHKSKSKYCPTRPTLPDDCPTLTPEQCPTCPTLPDGCQTLTPDSARHARRCPTIARHGMCPCFSCCARLNLKNLNCIRWDCFVHRMKKCKLVCCLCVC